MEEYYEILGLSKDASKQEIKHAYRRLCFKYHPDTNPASTKKDKEVLRKINAAYSVLGNTQKRQQYDAARFEYAAPNSCTTL